MYEFILQTRAKTIGSDEINCLIYCGKEKREKNRKKKRKEK